MRLTLACVLFHKSKTLWSRTPPITLSSSIRRMSGFTETVVTRTEEQRKHNFSWQQTMLRIKDPKITVPFYENNFGFRLLHKYDFPQWSFSLYFLYIPSDGGELFHIQNKPLMIANRKAARAWNRSI